MDSERIAAELRERYSRPLEEFYRRRIIFWHDEEREFEDRLEEIMSLIGGVKLVELDGKNFFAAKKSLLIDEPLSDYLVYCPLRYENPEDNWLLDIELYSEDFRADMASMCLEDMKLPNEPDLRRCVRNYRKFFRSNERRKSIAAMTHKPSDSKSLEVCMMSVLCGLREPDAGRVIMSAVRTSRSDECVLNEIDRCGLSVSFWEMAHELTGYDGEFTGGSLAVYVLVSASEHVMGNGGNAYCYGLVSEYLRPGEFEGFREVAEYVEAEEDLPGRFERCSLDDLTDNNIFPCVDYVILGKLMTDIAANIIDPDKIAHTVERRRLCVWHEDVKCYYGGLLELGEMQRFRLEHSGGFHTMIARDLWRKYAEEYCRMDTHYRKFHRNFSESLRNDSPELGDMFKSVAERVEGLYVSWYLSGLGSCWYLACGDDLRDLGYVPGVKKQEEFYGEYVANAGGKVYVIISDALRYEAAVSLSEELERDTRCRVRISAVQGIFPTTTKYGMAALLPHRKLTVERKGNRGLAVLADGMSTESPDREKVLKARNPNSTVLKYAEVSAMKRADRQARVKGMDVVYIYHSTIDDAGHMGRSVFGACDEAIGELKNMVRIITNDFGGTKIIITADHGFLYTYSSLREYDTVGLSGAGQEVETGRRYAVMTSGSRPDLLLPVKFLGGEYDGFTPAETVRIKVKGSNPHFVHGGVSLQELAVPVIEYRYLRNDSSEYRRNRSRYDTKPVSLGLLSPVRKVSAMTFSLNFWQKDSVSANREEAVYVLWFEDRTGQAVSDMVRVIADRKSRDAQERVFTCTFRLKAGEYDSRETYYLVMRSEEGREVLRTEFQISITDTKIFA